ncbi:MAG: hypothetical protein FGM58_09365 [Acidimicrobiia bacterium]|nr:hypothetical protein [Acidimicrobiia bacterium]
MSSAVPGPNAKEIDDRLAHAHRIERLLCGLGWFVAAVGIVGMAVFVGFWIAGDLNAEQAISLVLGTMLATVLSGASAYGSGVNIGLGAARLRLAAGVTSPESGSEESTPATQR